MFIKRSDGGSKYDGMSWCIDQNPQKLNLLWTFWFKKKGPMSKLTCDPRELYWEVDNIMGGCTRQPMLYDHEDVIDVLSLRHGAMQTTTIHLNPKIAIGKTQI